MSRMLGKLFQKAQGLKTKMDAVKGELKDKEVDGISADSFVKVRVSCDSRITSIDVDEDAFDLPKDKDKLVASIAEASNDALGRAYKVQKEAANKAMADIGLNLPGIF